MEANRCIFCERTFRVDELDPHMTSVHSRFRNWTINDGDTDYDWNSFRDLCPRAVYEEPIRPGQTLLPSKPRSLFFDMSLDPDAMAGEASDLIGAGGSLTQKEFMRCVNNLETTLGDRASLMKERFINALIQYLVTFDATDKISGTGGVRLEFTNIVVDAQGNSIPTGIQEKFVSWDTVFKTFNSAMAGYEYKVLPRRVARCLAPNIWDAIHSAQYLKLYLDHGTPESNHFGVDPQHWWTTLSFAADLKSPANMSETERKSFMRVAAMKYASPQDYTAFDSRPATGDPFTMRTPQARKVEEELHNARYGSRAQAFVRAENPMHYVRGMRGNWNLPVVDE